MKDFFTSFKYTFLSGTGPLEGIRYITDFVMEIYADEENKPEKLIGKVEFKIIHIDEAIEAGYDLYEIFDSHEYTFRHAQNFFDFETDEIKENIQKFYNYEIMGQNICLLERLEILPEYRGYKIGAKATKDILFHFGSGCGLFVIQAFPLQFESKNKEQDSWQKQLELNNFPSQQKTAFKQLRNFYKSIGFDEIPGYKDLLFYNPALINEKMDAINLEE